MRRLSFSSCLFIFFHRMSSQITTFVSDFCSFFFGVIFNILSFEDIKGVYLGQEYSSKRWQSAPTSNATPPGDLEWLSFLHVVLYVLNLNTCPINGRPCFSFFHFCSFLSFLCGSLWSPSNGAKQFFFAL